jgi:hypothetical protein
MEIFTRGRGREVFLAVVGEFLLELHTLSLSFGNREREDKLESSAADSRSLEVKIIWGFSAVFSGHFSLFPESIKEQIYGNRWNEFLAASLMQKLHTFNKTSTVMCELLCAFLSQGKERKFKNVT